MDCNDRSSCSAWASPGGCRPPADYSLAVSLDQGKVLHNNIIGNGVDLETRVGNTLINMYLNCGSLKDAHEVFDKLPKRNVVAWNVMIAGSARHLDYDMALEYFEGLQREHLEPDHVTFVCLLSLCSRLGLVDEGFLHFTSMQADHAIAPTLNHYGCMVELLGHEGHFCAAEDLLQTLPFGPSIVCWRSLLTQCRKHGSVELARQCFDHVVAVNHRDSSGFSLMSSIYAKAGMLDDAFRIEEMRRSVNSWKMPGQACIEVDSKLHNFFVRDSNHPQIDDIYLKLNSLSEHMKDEGYREQMDLVPSLRHFVGKEDTLCGHCERLAIAFGLISTSQGTTIRVSKNLRMCTDCHKATEIISQIEKREIIIMDAYCAHYFKDGLCSCNA